MAGHDRARAGGDGGAKGRELDAVQMRAVAGDGRKIEMRIRAGIAVAGEMLRGGEAAVFFDAAHERGDEFGDARRDLRRRSAC